MERQLVDDLPTAGGVLQVVTRVSLDRHAWWYRSTVQQNGVELQEGPWAPVVKDLTQEMAAFTITDGMRLAFAREALETHLARVAALERQLQPEPPSRPELPWSRILPIALGAVLLITVAGGAVWYFGTARSTPAPAQDQAAAPPAESKAPSATPEEPLGENEGVVGKQEEEPITAPAEEQAGDARPVPPQNQTGPSAPAPRPPRATPVPPDTSLGSFATPPSSGGTPARPEDPVEEDPAPRRSREPRPDSVLFQNVSPPDNGLAVLTPEKPAYQDFALVYRSVPDAFFGATCLRLTNDEGSDIASVSFTLGRRADVLVAHDRRIAKLPEWLQSFRGTGEELSVARVGQEEEVVYALYSKTMGPGRVELGPNTEARKLTRLTRRTLGQQRNMYIVCAQ